MRRSLRPFGGGWGAVLVVLTTVLLLSACDWSSRLFDGQHGNATADAGLTRSGVGTLAVKWRLPVPGGSGGGAGGEWFATPVTFKGVIYEGSARGCLFAIDEATGHVKWSKFTAFQPRLTCSQQLGIVSSVSVVDDGNGNPLLYFHSSDGYLYELNGLNG